MQGPRRQLGGIADTRLERLATLEQTGDVDQSWNEAGGQRRSTSRPGDDETMDYEGAASDRRATFVESGTEIEIGCKGTDINCVADFDFELERGYMCCVAQTRRTCTDSLPLAG